MTLEAIILSQDPLSTYNRCNFGVIANGGSSNSWSNFDYPNYYSSKLEDNKHPFPGIFDSYNINTNYDINEIINPWDNNHYPSPETHCTLDQYQPVEETPVTENPPAANIGSGGRRKRRRRSSKNKEEVEHQRMTHIAVERNRRKQMNDYLAMIRSLMPASYAQRGDQASIVGGAIIYVKELEQLLQSLEAHRRAKVGGQPPRNKEPITVTEESEVSTVDNKETPLSSLSTKFISPIFKEFFSFPQYSNRGSLLEQQEEGKGKGKGKDEEGIKGRGDSVSGNSGCAEIEVNMVDSHANVKILTKKQPKQLLKLVTGFQGLCLTILHLNVTSVDSLLLYSFSLKVEEGSQLNSVDDIAAAANHILRQIQHESSAIAPP